MIHAGSKKAPEKEKLSLKKKAQKESRKDLSKVSFEAILVLFLTYKQNR